MTLGAPSVQAITQSTLNARLTSCSNEFHRLITCCMIKISCQQLTLRSDGEKNQEKVVLFVFSEKREGAVKKHGSQSCLETYPGGEKGMEIS